MPVYTWRIVYELEDQPPAEVVADQRDVAQWELQPFGGPVANEQPVGVTFWRFLAWSACRRRGETKLTWAQWTDQCVEADLAVDPVAEDAEDPGQPGRSVTPS